MLSTTQMRFFVAAVVVDNSFAKLEMHICPNFFTPCRKPGIIQNVDNHFVKSRKLDKK